MMQNNFSIDEKTIVGISFEHEIWGRDKTRSFWCVMFGFLLISLIGMISNENSIYMTGIILFFIICNVVRILYICMKAKKTYKDKIYDCMITVSDNILVQEIRKDNEISNREEHNINDVKQLCVVKKYSFLYFENKKMIILDNRAFTTGNLDELKKWIKSRNVSEERTVAEKSMGNPFKVVKITLLVGVIVSLLMGILFVNNTANNANELVVVMLITLSGIVFSLIIGFGLTFYIDWFKRQSGIIRALSIIFYPITFFIFYFVGLGGMIPYSIKILKNNK